MLLGYEGGQRLTAVGGEYPPGVADDSARLDAFRAELVEVQLAANRSPGMGEVYTHWLEKWNEAGGHMLAPYSFITSPSMFGYRGLLEYQAQGSSTSDPATPKWDAVIDWIDNHPCGWGCEEGTLWSDKPFAVR